MGLLTPRSKTELSSLRNFLFGGAGKDSHGAAGKISGTGPRLLSLEGNENREILEIKSTVRGTARIEFEEKEEVLRTKGEGPRIPITGWREVCLQKIS